MAEPFRVPNFTAWKKENTEYSWVDLSKKSKYILYYEYENVTDV